MPRARTLDIARRVAAYIATHQSTQSDNPHVWGFRRDINVTAFPEGICPFCKGVIKSNAIWLIDTTAGVERLHAIGVVEGRKVAWYYSEQNRIHPHVGMSTFICMGDGDRGARSAEEALFFGMNPRGQYSSDVTSWGNVAGHLRSEVWNHDCAEMCEEYPPDEDEEEESYWCEICDDRFSTTHDTWYCGECQRTYCAEADNENAHSYCEFCDDCFWEEHAHNPRICIECVEEFDLNSHHFGHARTTMHYCNDCENYVCFRCFNNEEHDCNEGDE